MHPNHEGRSWIRRELEAFLQILALSSFAIAQPVLDVMGRSPETFVFRGAGRAEIVVFTVLAFAFPTVVLWSLAAATGLGGPRARSAGQWLVVGALIAVLAVQVLKKVTPLSTVPVVAAGGVIGAGAAAAFVRIRAAREWLRWGSLAAPAFALVFLLVSPVSRLVLPARAGAVAERADRTPVVMIVLDEFPLLSLLDPQGRLDADLFPNFASLAERATWYPNYTTVERHTLFAIPAMLTGQKQPDRSKVAVAADYPDNLFTLLSRSHRLHVSESLTQLCSPSVCSGSAPATPSDADRAEPPPATAVAALGRDAAGVWLDLTLPWRRGGEDTAQFADLADPEGPTPPETGSPGGPRQASGALLGIGALEEFLAALEGPSEPALHYLHVMLPHHPWRFFPSGTEYATPGGTAELPLVGTWLDEEWPVELSRERLRLQVQYVDRLLGRVVERMREAGLYDEALFLVTSDHGISVHEGRPHRLSNTRSNLHEVLWVPMFVKYPHQQEGEVDERNADATDLLPTIADVLDVEVPWRTDGHSMLGPPRRGPVKIVDRYPKEGDPFQLRISLEEGQRRLREEAFAPAARPEDLGLVPYAVGPGADLIGRRVDQLAVGATSGARAALDLPGGLERVDPAAGPLPAFVWGRLMGAPAGTHGPVVAALNGRVAGASTTWTHTDGTPDRFAVLIPESLFRPGENDLELFLLEDGMLRPLGSA